MFALRKLLTLFVLIISFSSVTRAGGPPKDAKIDRARAMLKLLVDEKFGDFVAASDSTMKSVLPESKLKDVWLSVKKDFGPYQSEMRTTSQVVGEVTVVDILCRFQQSALNIKISLNQKDEAAGLFFTPSSEGVEYIAPAYVDKNAFTETEVTVSAGKFPLPGTLTLPKGSDRIAAAVLVHGSGPNDRDASLIENKPFKDLAWGLASKGIAVLRYEKRTKQHGYAMDENKITLEEEVIDDAAAAVRLLLTNERIDPKRVYVIGHSLGASAAPYIAMKEPGVHGIVMLAAAARPIADLVEDQIQYIAAADGVVDANEKAKIDDTLNAIKELRSGKAKDDVSILGAPVAYWKELDKLDAVNRAMSIPHPILVLQGGRDYQVSAEKDFGIWKKKLEGRKNVTLKQFDNLDHLFRPGSGPSVPADYQRRSYVDGAVIDTIAKWIKETP